jgi:hypothetical protein
MDCRDTECPGHERQPSRAVDEIAGAILLRIPLMMNGRAGGS